MEFTGERFVPLNELMQDEIAFEHLHRYHAAKELVKGKVVLDIACGEGYGSDILSMNAERVIGVDIDADTIEHAKNKYIKNNLQFLTGSTDNIPVAENSVDIVVSYETIEHINEESQTKFLDEIKRVLKDDGILIISTPDKTNYTDRYAHKNEFHLKEFEKEEFVSFLSNYFNHTSCFLQGYEIIDAITESSPDDVKDLYVVNWPRQSKPFTRKYIIAVSSDYDTTALTLTSAVFQVNKSYLEIMDTLVEKEAHIVELGSWGKSLDKEIENKNQIIKDLQKQNQDVWQSKEQLHELIYKQGITIENLSTLERERAEIKEKYERVSAEKKLIEETAVKKDEIIQELKQSGKYSDKDVERINNVVASQAETIRLLKQKVEDYSNKLQALDEDNNHVKELNRDKDDIIRQVRDRERDISSQLEIKSQRLNEIYTSEGWKMLSIYYKLKGKLIPEHSARYKYLKKAFNNLRGKREPGTETNSTAFSETKLRSTEFSEPLYVFNILEFKLFQAPVVSIIIPVHNGWHMTYKCLMSIYQYTSDVSYEIIIADDGATDETKNIENYIKNVTVIRNDLNLGFLNNCNNAAKAARGKYVLFLNNDTEVTPGWLSSLTELLDRDNSIGMTGSKLIYPNGRLQEAGGIIWNDASGWNFGNNGDPADPAFNYVKEVDYISGAALMIRKDLWGEIGGFDQQYAPAYFEDADLAFAVRKKGYKVVYQPLSVVIHYEGLSHGTDTTSGIKKYQLINKPKFIAKWKTQLENDHFVNGENVFWARDRSRYKKTILVIDHYVPQFDKDAGSKTVFQYLKLFVSMNLNVKFIGDNFFRHEPYTTTLQQIGIEVLYGPWYAENWMQWIKDNHNKFDYILLNRPHISVKYMDFIKEKTNAKVLYYGHDLHFVRMLKQYEIDNKPETLKDAEKWKKIETSLFNKADIVLTPSEQEKSFINELNVETPVYSIKAYIFDFIPEPISDFSERKDVLFVGGFTHGPNADGVLWFVKEVWPHIKQNISGGKFIIVGSNVTPEIMALAADDIQIIGFLSETELQKLYKKVKLVVIPLRYGAGVKGKTVEAMYNGIPLVSTDFGLEGLPGAPHSLTPRNKADDFASEVVRLYNAPENELEGLSKMETGYIHDHFYFEVVKKELNEILNRLAS
jgi:GT2 family glycosyltransferase/2-polyprenyl-3-methyl-5-hydroxy-6-metoxy-1,4-benzoquinol methylase